GFKIERRLLTPPGVTGDADRAPKPWDGRASRSKLVRSMSTSRCDAGRRSLKTSHIRAHRTDRDSGLVLTVSSFLPPEMRVCSGSSTYQSTACMVSYVISASRHGPTC